MLDIQIIRDNPDLVREKAKQKGYEVDTGRLLELDKKRRSKLTELEKLQAEQNIVSNSYSDTEIDDVNREALRKQKTIIKDLQQEVTQTEEELKELLKKVPNLPLDDVPVGVSEDENVVVREWGEKPTFDFKPLNHWQIGQNRGWIDKERAAKVAGARFVYLKGDLVLLEFALWQYALTQLTDENVLKKIISDNNLNVSSKPFTPVLPPAVAKKEVFEATGRLNKEEQTYKIEGEDLWINASAEHTLAPMYMNEIIDEVEFPVRFVGYTTAFRREAGSYGKDTEGILRLHQFNKLEMEVYNIPESSLDEHLFLVAVQEYLMQDLGLHYQLLNKCTADIGFPNARGMDINTWMPGQDAYRETHTADYLTDFQAQSMKTRVRRSDGTITLVHTNDATVFSERPLAAILENFQTKDGKIKIPIVLQPYLGGREFL